MATAQATTDHDEIRQWVESRGGHPARVAATGSRNDPGILRIDFPGFSGEDTLEEIEWDQFFEWFDRDKLALLLSDDADNRFNKFVSRGTATKASSKKSGSKGGAKKASSKKSSAKSSSSTKRGATGSKGGAKKASSKKSSAKSSSSTKRAATGSKGGAKKASSKKSSGKSSSSTKRAATSSKGSAKKASSKKSSAKSSSKKASSSKKSSSTKRAVRTSSKKTSAKSSATKGGAKKASSKKSSSQKTSRSSTKKSSKKASSITTTNHDEIRSWVEARGGFPAHVRRTGRNKNDLGVLRIDYPGYSGAGTLERIDWERWFEAFEANDLAFLYQDKRNSRFSKLVAR